MSSFANPLTYPIHGSSCGFIQIESLGSNFDAGEWGSHVQPNGHPVLHASEEQAIETCNQACRPRPTRLRETSRNSRSYVTGRSQAKAVEARPRPIRRSVATRPWAKSDSDTHRRPLPVTRRCRGLRSRLSLGGIRRRPATAERPHRRRGTNRGSSNIRSGSATSVNGGSLC